MSDNRFSIPLAKLEDQGHVAVSEQVEEHAQRRWHAPLDCLVLPFGDGVAHDADGD